MGRRREGVAQAGGAAIRPDRARCLAGVRCHGGPDRSSRHARVLHAAVGLVRARVLDHVGTHYGGLPYPVGVAIVSVFGLLNVWLAGLVIGREVRGARSAE